MTDKEIIKYYKKGYTVDAISNAYHKYVNRNKKPIQMGTYKIYPVKLLTKSDARLHVSSVIYHHLMATDLAHTQK